MHGINLNIHLCIRDRKTKRQTVIDKETERDRGRDIQTETDRKIDRQTYRRDRKT